MIILVLFLVFLVVFNLFTAWLWWFKVGPWVQKRIDKRKEIAEATKGDQ